MEGDFGGGHYSSSNYDEAPGTEEIETPEMDAALVSVLADAMNQASEHNRYVDDVLKRAEILFGGLSELYDTSWVMDTKDSGAIGIRREGGYSSLLIQDGSLHVNANNSLLRSAARVYFKGVAHEWVNDSGYNNSYVHYTNGVSYYRHEDSFSKISFPLQMVCEHNILEKIIGHYILAKDRAISANKTDKPEYYDTHMKKIRAATL